MSLGSARAVRMIAAAGMAAAALGASAQALDDKGADELMDKYFCSGCHQIDKKMVGPGFRDVAKKYAGDPAASAQLAARVRNGGQGVWGPVAMPANAEIPDADLRALMGWILALPQI
jgi:cytochrome c